MRFAVLADTHGDLPALEAVLHEEETYRIPQVREGAPRRS
jgi:hypothetical protein